MRSLRFLHGFGIAVLQAIRRAGTMSPQRSLPSQWDVFPKQPATAMIEVITPEEESDERYRAATAIVRSRKSGPSKDQLSFDEELTDWWCVLIPTETGQHHEQRSRTHAGLRELRASASQARQDS